MANPLFRRGLFTVTLMVAAVVAASAGVLAWRMLNPPPVQVVTLPAPAGPAAVSGAGEARDGLKVGDRRPDFTLPDTDGRARSVSEFDGRLLVVNFWATWCPPCLEEIPAFVRLQDAYAARGVQFLGVALDRVEDVRAFMTEHAVNYPSVHGEREAIALSKAYGNRIGALPFTVLVGRDGTVVAMHQGILREGDARTLIEAHL